VLQDVVRRAGVAPFDAKTSTSSSTISQLLPRKTAGLIGRLVLSWHRPAASRLLRASALRTYFTYFFTTFSLLFLREGFNARQRLHSLAPQ